MSAEEEVHLAFDRMRGRLAGFVEACGLNAKQERGLVSTMKSLSYDTEREVYKAAGLMPPKVPADRT